MSLLAKKVASAATLTFAASAATAVTQAAILVVLARLLTPTDYGKYAVATITYRLTVGLLISVIERGMLTSGRSGSHESMNALLPLICVGVLGTLGTVTSYWVFAKTDFQMFVGLAVLQLTALPLGLALPTRIKFRRDLRVKPIIVADLLSQIIGLGLCSIALSVAGLGAIALPLGSLIQGCLQASVLLMVERPTFIKPVTRSSLVTPLITASHVLPTAILELLFVQLPSIIVGWQLGVAALGLFNRMFSLIQLPLEMLTSSMTRVLIAGLIQARDDPARMKRALSRLVKTTAMMILPLIGGMIGSHLQLIQVILGTEWLEGQSFIPWLCISTTVGVFAHLFALASEAGALYFEKSKLQAKVIAVQAALLLCGAYWMGLVGVAIALVLANSYFLAGNLALVRTWLNVCLSEVLIWSRAGLCAGVVSFAVAYTISLTLQGTPPMTMLSLQVGLCAAAACVSTVIAGRQELLELLGALGFRLGVGSQK